MDFLSGLNPQQQQAVLHVNGPLLILAGAGSGKTRVVTHRIGHLIANHNVVPERILAVTFTNKAAREMRERVEKLVELPPRRGPNVFTFHSFCVRLLRRDGAGLQKVRPTFTRDFLIYDDDDQLALLKSLCRQMEIDEKALPPRNVLSVISAAKNRGETPADLARKETGEKGKYVVALYEKYSDALIRANALDFDDLLLESVRLLEVDQPTREKWNDWIEHLMVDEYQDTNSAQYTLTRLLSQQRRNVCVVGDEDQSIYSWRGADIRNILDFHRDFPDAVTIRLEQNYRSTRNILRAAGAVIANNRERLGKNLWTDAGDGPSVTVYQAPDGEGEALWIADRIRRQVEREPRKPVAVLYRTNFQSRQIEEALRRYRINYAVVGGLSFYQRAEIKDMLAYLKLLAVPSDAVSLLRVINVPARGIGKTTVEQIENHATQQGIPLWEAIEDLVARRQLGARAENAVVVFRNLIEELRAVALSVPVHELLEAILDRTGYRQMLKEDRTPGAENRIENIDELLNAAAEASERGESLTDFLDHAALVADADQVDERKQVSLLTVHNAKGLEFPVVFLAGMEEGLFPHNRSIDTPGMIEEERRLCYVGITRAREQLFVSYAQARRRYGGGPLEPAIASRFVRELPPELCDFQGLARSFEEHGIATGDEIDLFAERGFVRETAAWRPRPTGGLSGAGKSARSPAPGNFEPAVRQKPKQPYPGKTYNSVENISAYFKERGLPANQPHERPAPVVPISTPRPPAPAAGSAPSQPAGRPTASPSGPAGGKKKVAEGSTVDHPKYGRGTIVRKEGDGDEAKLTILFQRHGMKKLIARFAGIKLDE